MSTISAQEREQLKRFQQKPIFRHDHVEGIMAESGPKVERYFYLLWQDGINDTVFEADGYRVGKSDLWMIIFTCPKCHTPLRLGTDKKPIQITEKGIETGEPLGCPNEHHEFGPCGWRGEFAPPPQRMDVNFVNTDGKRGRVRIDAVIKKA